MVCECVPPGPDERGVLGCGDDCLNRMLFIEWSVLAWFETSPFTSSCVLAFS